MRLGFEEGLPPGSSETSFGGLSGGISAEESVHEAHDERVEAHRLATRDVQSGLCDLARTLGNETPDVGPLGDGLHVDAVDESVDVDTVEQAVDIDAIQQAVDVHAVEQTVDVHAIEKLIDVDASEELVEVHLPHEPVYVDTLEHRVDESRSAFVLARFAHDSAHPDGETHDELEIVALRDAAVLAWDHSNFKRRFGFAPVAT